MLNDGGNENGKTNTQTKKKHVSLATTKKQQKLCRCCTLLYQMNTITILAKGGSKISHITCCQFSPVLATRSVARKKN